MRKLLTITALVNGLFSSESKDSELKRENARRTAFQKEILYHSIEARQQEIERLTIELNKTRDESKKKKYQQEIKEHLDQFIKTYGECDD